MFSEEEWQVRQKIVADLEAEITAKKARRTYHYEIYEYHRREAIACDERILELDREAARLRGEEF